MPLKMLQGIWAGLPVLLQKDVGLLHCLSLLLSANLCVSDISSITGLLYFAAELSLQCLYRFFLASLIISDIKTV